MNCIKTESLTWFRKTNIVIRSFRVIFSEFPKISTFFFLQMGLRIVRTSIDASYCSLRKYINTFAYLKIIRSKDAWFLILFTLIVGKLKKKKKTRRGFIAFLRLSDDKSKKRTVKISFTVDTRRVKEETYPTIGTKIRNLILRKINDLEK